MSCAYDEYLAEHIINVGKGLRWMLDNLPLSQEEKNAIEDATHHEHDSTKYNRKEYFAYDDYFYGGNRTDAVVTAFNYAWLHHIHNNPHHWQYWVLMEYDPETFAPYKSLMIPLSYIFEMIADWWTFSWKNGNLFEIFSWYAEHRDKQIMHPQSRAVVENILKRIWNILVMQEVTAGHDISDIEAQYMRVWAEQDSIEHSDLSDEEDENKFGVPELKKFPMPDKRHVKSAIRFFNYIDPKHEKELAEAILERMEEYGMVLGEDISVGDDNRFKKYLPEEKES